MRIAKLGKDKKVDSNLRTAPGSLPPNVYSLFGGLAW